MEKIWNDKAREINMQMIVEIRKNLNGLRREIKENLNELRKEVKREVRGLKNRIDDLENRYEELRRSSRTDERLMAPSFTFAENSTFTDRYEITKR